MWQYRCQGAQAKASHTKGAHSALHPSLALVQTGNCLPISAPQQHTQHPVGLEAVTSQHVSAHTTPSHPPSQSEAGGIHQPNWQRQSHDHQCVVFNTDSQPHTQRMICMIPPAAPCSCQHHKWWHQHHISHLHFPPHTSPRSSHLDLHTSHITRLTSVLHAGRDALDGDQQGVVGGGHCGRLGRLGRWLERRLHGQW